VNKTELIHEVAEQAGLSNKKAGEALTAVFEAISAALEKGDKVQVAGFGVFEARQRAAREARNPQNPSQTVKVPARKVPAFRPGKALKDRVN